MKKTPPINNIFSSDRVVLVISVITAVICWMVVAMTTPETIEVPIRDVPVNLDIKAEILADVGLQMVPIGETLVDVRVNGQRTVVGNLMPEDLTITAQVSKYTEPGTYSLVLVYEGEAEGFEVTSIEPAAIRVQFDQIASEVFTIELEQDGISVPPDHMLDTPTVRPATVTVTGPQSELERIEKALAVVKMNDGSLYSTYTANVPIILHDAAGNKIIPEDSSLALNYDNVDVVIPVLKIKTVPLRIDFTNQPDDFPIDQLLSYAVTSKSDIRIAGPVTRIDNTNNIRVGAIDLREITPAKNTFSFDIVLSDQFDNLDNITTTTITFDTDYWTTKTFNVGNILKTNEPPGYAVELLTTSLSVTFVGPEDIIETMTTDDIIAEARLSDQEVVAGQYRYPIRLSAPTKGLVWPVGEYSVVIQAESLNIE